MGRRKSELTYMLPHTVYQETIWFIRDYPNMKLRAEEILASSSAPDGGGRGSERYSANVGLTLSLICFFPVNLAASVSLI